MILKFIKKVTKDVNLSVRVIARVLFVTTKKVKDPRLTVAATSVVIKKTSVVVQQYKRANHDPDVIFEDAVDAVINTF